MIERRFYDVDAIAFNGPRALCSPAFDPTLRDARDTLVAVFSKSLKRFRRVLVG